MWGRHPCRLSLKFSLPANMVEALSRATSLRRLDAYLEVGPYRGEQALEAAVHDTASPFQALAALPDPGALEELSLTVHESNDLGPVWHWMDGRAAAVIAEHR